MINMRRILTTLALCAVAAMGFSGIATATASAALPKFTKFKVCVDAAAIAGWPAFTKASIWYWNANNGGKCETHEAPNVAFALGRGDYGESPFYSESGAGTLETEKGEKVECTDDLDIGEITGERSVRTVVKFTGCKGPLASHCQTAAAKEGEIITKTLAGKLVYIDEATKEVGIALAPASGTEFVSFECVGLFGIKATLKVRGSVIGALTPTNTKTSTFALAFKQTKGVQEPTTYEEGGKTFTDHLETESKGAVEFAYEQSGEQTTDTIHTAEEGKVEG
jgi:uncharacterized membrane protein YtjA (UPF0391 family)